MVERTVKGKYNRCDVNSVFNRRYQEKKNRCPAIVGISGDRNTISGNHKVFDHTGNLWRRILGSVFARNRQSDR